MRLAMKETISYPEKRQPEEANFTHSPGRGLNRRCGDRWHGVEIASEAPTVIPVNL
jgi:hypothetical protein